MQRLTQEAGQQVEAAPDEDTSVTGTHDETDRDPDVQAFWAKVPAPSSRAPAIYIHVCVCVCVCVCIFARTGQNVCLL